MGLLDSIVGQVAGAVMNSQGGGQAGGVMGIVSQLLAGQGQGGGGIQGLISAFTAQGLGSQVQSWVGTGQNLPVSGEQITQALGSGQIQQFAQQLGLSQQDTANQLANILPNVVDKLTPNGAVPEGGIQENALGGILKGILG